MLGSGVGSMQSNEERTEQQREVYYHILTHLASNPDAGDTLEGIGEWWLLEQKIRFELQRVSSVLTSLVSQGLILELEGIDSHVIYRVNRDKEIEIRTILNQRSNNYRGVGQS